LVNNYKSFGVKPYVYCILYRLAHIREVLHVRFTADILLPKSLVSDLVKQRPARQEYISG